MADKTVLDWLMVLLVLSPGIALLVGLALDTTPPNRPGGWIHGSHTD